MVSAPGVDSSATGPVTGSDVLPETTFAPRADVRRVNAVGLDEYIGLMYHSAIKAMKFL
jgi:hypothetical protein